MKVYGDWHPIMGGQLVEPLRDDFMSEKLVIVGFLLLMVMLVARIVREQRGDTASQRRLRSIR
jgi:hypothetical protein